MKRNLRSQHDFQSVMLRNQLTSLVLFETLTTTAAKAKPLIPFVNRFLNRVKSKDMNAKRLAGQVLLDENAAKKVFEEILPRFSETETNFVREYSLMPRRGDNAPQTMITFTKTLEVSKKEASVKAESKTVVKDSKKTKVAV